MDGFNTPRVTGDRSKYGNSNGGGNNNNRNNGGNNYQSGYPDRNGRLPDNYLKDGYFDETNDKTGLVVKKLKKELVLNVAEDLSKAFNYGNTGRDGIKSSQLRKFYDYCVNIKEKMRLLDNSFDGIESDIAKLVSFAAYSKTKKTVPTIFYDFIKLNTDTIKTKDDFVKGFLEHFQAIVAFYPKNN